MKLAVALAALLAASAVGAPAARAAGGDDALQDLKHTEQVFVDIAKRVAPAVVNIRRFEKDEAWWQAAHAGSQDHSRWRRTSDDDLVVPDHRPQGVGARGFVISADGYVLTLRRVVVNAETGRPADAIDVEIGSKHLPADVVSLEPTLDLAILKVKSPEPLPFLKLGDSAVLDPGRWAIAFGDPDGRERTMVPGFIAYQPSRECYQDELSATYLQTSVPVCDGALGGPLVDLDGEVVGINTRRGDSAAKDGVVQIAGSGYALPINLVIAIYQSLLARQSTVSPWLGVSVLRLDDALRQKVGDPRLNGVYIDNVFDPSPASTVGIKIGDVLQSMDGQSIADVYEFQRELYRAGAGKVVKLKVYREKRSRELTAKIGIRPPMATTR